MHYIQLYQSFNLRLRLAIRTSLRMLVVGTWNPLPEIGGMRNRKGNLIGAHSKLFSKGHGNGIGNRIGEVLV